ncbi:MAG TPA: hypothetical protein DCG54_09675 [Anaerolineae bacterium]|nr:hypothetical protein [Anaerolineae bacterium]
MSSSNVKYVLQVVLSILTFGVVWAVDNQAAIITALAILIVWAINVITEHLGVKFGRQMLTTGLYVVSLGLVVMLNPVALPAWPVMDGGEPALVMVAFGTWLQMLVFALLPYTAGAMTIYNLLLKAVLERLSPPIDEPDNQVVG